MNISKLKHWLRENDFDCDVKRDNYVSYSCSEDCIYISDEPSEHQHLFNKFIKGLGYNGTLNDHTIDFLHELGHAETMDDLSDVYYIISGLLKKIVETDSYSEFVRDIKANIYYRLPIEKVATQWAVDYINNYPEEVEELDRLFNGRKKR